MSLFLQGGAAPANGQAENGAAEAAGDDDDVRCCASWPPLHLRDAAQTVCTGLPLISEFLHVHSHRLDIAEGGVGRPGRP